MSNIQIFLYNIFYIVIISFYFEMNKYYINTKINIKMTLITFLISIMNDDMQSVNSQIHVTTIHSQLVIILKNCEIENRKHITVYEKLQIVS